MPRLSKASALKKIRDACLRADVILAMNEVEDQWINESLGVCVKNLRAALKILDPAHRPPDMMRDTALGRDIQKSLDELETHRGHELKPCGLPRSLKREKRRTMPRRPDQILPLQD